MTIEAMEKAEAEAKRFLTRIDELREITNKLTYKYSYWPPKETGALRRASMDLTRALAEMRKY